MFTRILSQNTGDLNNPSEQAIFGSKRIKEHHDTMKLLNEEGMVKNTFNLN